MSEEKHESLSAFIDGENPEGTETRLLDEVLSDESLSRRWASYHLIGDIIRKHAHVHVQQVVPREAANNIHDLRPRRYVLGPVGGLALAASVALVAIFGIHSLSTGDTAPLQTASTAATDSKAASLPVFAQTSAGNGDQTAVPVRRVATAAAADRRATRLNWNDATPAVATRLNGYLVTHNEHLVNGMRGMLPYARIVAYDGQGN